MLRLTPNVRRSRPIAIALAVGLLFSQRRHVPNPFDLIYYPDSVAGQTCDDDYQVNDDGTCDRGVSHPIPPCDPCLPSGDSGTDQQTP